MYCNIFAIAAAKNAPGSPEDTAVAAIKETLAMVAVVSVAVSMPSGSISISTLSFSQLDGDIEHSVSH